MCQSIKIGLRSEGAKSELKNVGFEKGVPGRQELRKTVVI